MESKGKITSPEAYSYLLKVVTFLPPLHIFLQLVLCLNPVDCCCWLICWLYMCATCPFFLNLVLPGHLKPSLAGRSIKQQGHRQMWVNSRTGFERCCMFWKLVLLPLKDWALQPGSGNPPKLDLAFSRNYKPSKFSKPSANGSLSEDQ